MVIRYFCVASRRGPRARVRSRTPAVKLSRIEPVLADLESERNNGLPRAAVGGPSHSAGEG